MIVDITNELFTGLKRTLSPTLCTEPSIGEIAKFPLVTFEELVNATHTGTIDSSGETHNSISFEVVIYTKGSTATSEMKKIRQKVDKYFDEHNMNRVMSRGVNNYLDVGVKRHVIRYNCIVSKNKQIFRG